MTPCFALFVLTIGIVHGHGQYQQQPNQQYYQPPPSYGYAPPQSPQRDQYGRALVQPQQPLSFFQPPPQYAPSQLQSNKPKDSEAQRYLTPPSLKFKIGIVANKVKDTNRNEDTGSFSSFLREGHLYLQTNKSNPESPNITIEFDEEKGVYPLESGLNYGGKGFQLSTLNVFNGKLYSCDHKTGIVYELKKVDDEAEQEQPRDRDYIDQNIPDNDQPEEKKQKYVATPWIILPNGNSTEPFKCEWGIIRDNKLWIGSTGALKNKKEKEADDDADAVQGDEQNQNQGPTEFSKERQFVKRIGENGEVEDIDFSKHYEDVAETYDVNLREGQVIHEAVEFSDETQKWLFIPRRVTKEKKNKETWDSISTNQGVFADDPFDDFTSTEFGTLNSKLGVVSLRYIPGTNDQFVLALKYGKDEGNSATKLAVYHVSGKEVMPETDVAEGFYSGVEFL